MPAQAATARRESTVLMLAGAIPQLDGSTPRRHAWRLRNALSQGHEVHLAAIADGPINLRHWRELHRQTERLLIGPGGPWRRGRRRLARDASDWLLEVRYRAVATTDPRLLQHLDTSPIRLSLMPTGDPDIYELADQTRGRILRATLPRVLERLTTTGHERLPSLAPAPVIFVPAGQRLRPAA